MTTISDKKAEKCLSDWINHMVETNNLSFETVLKLHNGKIFHVAIWLENDSKTKIYLVTEDIPTFTNCSVCGKTLEGKETEKSKYHDCENAEIAEIIQSRKYS